MPNITFYIDGGAAIIGSVNENGKYQSWGHKNYCDGHTDKVVYTISCAFC